MWEPGEQGLNRFRVSGWSMEVACDPSGVRLAAIRDDDSSSTTAVAGLISMPDSPLPLLTEQFVRGDEFHLAMPQSGADNAGLDIAITVILADHDQFIVETTVSLQTLWLDVYPAVALHVPGTGGIRHQPRSSAIVFSRAQSDSRHDSASVRVFVDVRDQVSLIADASHDECVQFFGDFMEKGVIRKVQPWWVWSRKELTETQCNQIADSLAKRPLPLAT